MAALNEILQGRFNQLLTRLLVLSGGAPAPQLTPEIQPTVSVVGDDPENRFLKGERLMQFGVGATGGTANAQSYIQVFNPPGSQLLVIIEAFLVNNITTIPISMLFGQTTISNRAPVSVQPRDSRVNPGLGQNIKGPGGGVFGTDATGDGVAGPALTGFGSVPLLSDTAIFVPVVFVLAPGDAFSLVNGAIGYASSGVIFYRARPAALGELQL